MQGNYTVYHIDCYTFDCHNTTFEKGICF
jgi:hypothetical protein